VTAIVHLAAIPAPGLATNSMTFATNTISTYNVFEAARQLGIKNVVWASSETVLGLPFDTPPPYVPIDEEYPGRPESAYSLSKLVGVRGPVFGRHLNASLRPDGRRFAPPDRQST